ncbi:MAG: flagellar brake protein [Desulfobacterales bacterium]|nr:flagellar brake protein [Desulfobacterales bacterium]
MTPEQHNAAPQNSPLSIDLECPLFIQCKGQKERFKSRLVGFVPDGYLIVATPGVPGIQNILAAHESVLVRYIHHGEVFGFKTSVIGTILSPFRLTFLACPPRVERINLRKAPRVDCHIPATLTTGDRSLTGMILDISSGGCRFSARAQGDGETPHIHIGAAVEISFPLLGQEGAAKVQGKIKNVHHDGDRLVLGIFFSDLDPEMSKRIADYVQEVSGFL